MLGSLGGGMLLCVGGGSCKSGGFGGGLGCGGAVEIN